MVKCPYCKYSEGPEFLKIKTIEAEKAFGDPTVIVIFGCPKCKGIFFEYEFLL